MSKPHYLSLLPASTPTFNHTCILGGSEGSIDDVDSWDVPEEVEELRPGTNLSVKVSVLEASGLPAAYSHNLFCQYKFWGQEDALIIPPLITAGAQDVPAPVGVHQFQHRQVFTVEVTEDFLDYVQDGALAVEVWGHRRSGFIDNVPADAGEKRNRYTLYMYMYIQYMY